MDPIDEESENGHKYYTQTINKSYNLSCGPYYVIDPSRLQQQ